MDKARLLALTTDIVSAHASITELTQEQLLQEIGQVFRKLAELSGGGEAGEEQPATEPVREEAVPEKPAAAKPAVPLDAAFGAEKVFCMVCGQGMKTLKRHLSVAHGLKPGQYRKQFGIPSGTPLVARNYSDARKAMAKELNLADRLVKARASRRKKKA